MSTIPDMVIAFPFAFGKTPNSFKSQKINYLSLNHSVFLKWATEMENLPYLFPRVNLTPSWPLLCLVFFCDEEALG